MCKKRKEQKKIVTAKHFDYNSVAVDLVMLVLNAIYVHHVNDETL